MITRIHVNTHRLKANAKNGTDHPVITVKRGRENEYAHEVEIRGPSRVVYSKKPLSCGARCWVETESNVTIFERLDGGFKIGHSFDLFKKKLKAKWKRDDKQDAETFRAMPKTRKRDPNKPVKIRKGYL